MTDSAVAAANAANTIAMWSAAAGWASAMIAAGAAIFSWFQWRKINRKMAMLTDSGANTEVLPAWYTRRMVDEHWLFGLPTVDGRSVVIKRIVPFPMMLNGWMLNLPRATRPKVFRVFWERSSLPLRRIAQKHP